MTTPDGQVIVQPPKISLIKKIGGGSVLTEKQVSNLNRFKKKIPANSKDSVTVEYHFDGSVTFKAISPARYIPGSHAEYIKQVDIDGNTTSYIKDTYAPDGSVVHSKIKY